ncbi:hypothetical protein BACCAP_00642 [Pseudoflavonifractor capillosus ATCC 29799]|uniref:Uncharacterized protein n=1 Tax=Pseudoflavonifractor capillosus ATCC 29799 TaxID=411467 RepID=A6NR18_9FIRM|nr:hypothetical protein BACCAP_00642 [Pseudoflavonifractor capillosus ATCC 29799]
MKRLEESFFHFIRNFFVKKRPPAQMEPDGKREMKKIYFFKI